jgi:hypothetical protein
MKWCALFELVCLGYVIKFHVHQYMVALSTKSLGNSAAKCANKLNLFMYEVSNYMYVNRKKTA